MKKRFFLASAIVVAIVIALVVLTSCGGSGSSTANPAANPAPATKVPASAVVQTPTAEQIAAKMGIKNVFAFNEKTDPNNLLGRKGGYTSKVNWGGDTADTSFNSIEVFPNVADAQARLDYVSAFKPPFGDGYDYINGAALLRLSADLTPTQAHALEAAFHSAAG